MRETELLNLEKMNWKSMKISKPKSKWKSWCQRGQWKYSEWEQCKYPIS